MGDVKLLSIEELKECWDSWDGISNCDKYDVSGEDVHTELNIRGEGYYCAV